MGSSQHATRRRDGAWRVTRRSAASGPKVRRNPPLPQAYVGAVVLERGRLASRKRPVKWVPCLIWFLPAKVGMVGYGDGVEYGYSCGDYR